MYRAVYDILRFPLPDYMAVEYLFDILERWVVLDSSHPIEPVVE